MTFSVNLFSLIKRNTQKQSFLSNMKFYGLVDANNKPFGRLLPVEMQVIIMFWASVAETNDKRKKVSAQLVRIPVCRNTHIP